MQIINCLYRIVEFNYPVKMTKFWGKKYGTDILGKTHNQGCWNGHPEKTHA